MPKEKTLEQRISGGHDAARFRNNPVFKEAIEKLREGYTEQWTRSRPDETQKRETLYNKLAIVSEIVEELEKMIWDGEAAEKQREREERGKRL
jgi:hypothetical protein